MTKVLLALCCCLAAAAETPTFEAFQRAIRANDLETLRKLSTSGVNGIKDRLDWTPLHYAAVFGNPASVRILADAGADPNARNTSQATPLMYAAWNLEMTKLLSEKGGDVNARATDGSTPLWVAAGVQNNDATVRYLVEKGADPNYIRAPGDDYLIRAAALQDAATIRFLLSKGLTPHRADGNGLTALSASIGCDGGEKTRILITAGADVNRAAWNEGLVRNGPIESTNVTPLMDASSCAELESVKALLHAGAKINARDDRGMTALMIAIAMDGANPEVIRYLVKAGSDLKAADYRNETALDWARKFRNPAILAILQTAGAPSNGLPTAPRRPDGSKPDLNTAINKASALVAGSSQTFLKEGGGCVGCHHQPFASFAFGALKRAGAEPEPRLRKVLSDGLLAMGAPSLNRLPLMNIAGGGYVNIAYPLWGAAEMGEPASATTDVMVHYIAEAQAPNGSWPQLSSRAPLSESAITRTMLSVQALKSYSWPARQAEFNERLARARVWLTKARPVTTVEQADRLLALWLTDSPRTVIEEAAKRLLGAQGKDGGWAQSPWLESDAYGTSATMIALVKSGNLTPADSAWQRAKAFLLNTQFPDGSWYVRSRAVKLQPYFESGFPYGHDQWISNSATGYAVAALAPGLKQ